MYSNTQKAFKFSVVLHLGGFAVIALLVWFDRIPNKIPEPHIFTLVSQPSSPATDMPTDTAEPQLPSKIEFPQPKQLKQLPKIEPLPPPPQKIKEIKPAPSPPKTLSYAEFIQQQGQPKVQQRSSRPKPVHIPRIQTEDITQNPAAEVNTASGPSPDVLNRYISALRDKISRHWSKPQNVGGHDIKVEVEFVILPSGQLTGVRILNPSGIEDFDASVRAAFASLQKVGVGVPPEGVARKFSLTLRMKDLKN